MDTTSDRMSVGMIGLGAMGLRMATRLGETFPVVAYDVVKPAVLPESVQFVDGPAEVSARCDVVCMSLPTAAASLESVSAIAGAADNRTTLLIELSTIGLDAVHTSARIARDAGISYIDAPVSGGIRPARSGELSTMIAGDPAAVERAMQVIQQLASQVFVMGEQPGLGQVMKLANNIIALTSIVITSEAIAFGRHYGLEMADMVNVINASTGRTHASEVKFPISIIPGTFNHGARGEITSKDVALFVAEATAADTPMFVSLKTNEVWQGFVHTHPETDFTYIYKYIEEQLKDAPSVAEGQP